MDQHARGGGAPVRARHQPRDGPDRAVGRAGGRGAADEPAPAWLEACAGEIFVGRLGPDRTDLRAPAAQQLAAAGGPWRCSVWTLMWWRVRAERGDRVPFVGLVAGLALVGGEIAGVTPTPGPGRPQAHFDLVPAGDWFEVVRGRRLGPPVGPAWFVAGRGRPLDTIGA